MEKDKTGKEKCSNGWNELSDTDRKKVFAFSQDYIDFLNQGKTEREVVKTVQKLAEAAGFQDLDQAGKLKAGDKVYRINRGKSMFLAVIGKKDITEGIRAVGSHIDSPRLDLKPNPLYEDGGLALLKTHYYGGIKKYQWTAIPLSIHGVVAKDDGQIVEVNLGEDDNDPIFTITDLLPHLGADQGKKTLSQGIEGEALNLLTGSIPMPDCEKEPVLQGILKLLEKKYGIKEDDFISAELEAVPAFAAKTLGLDESLVAGYGQDDRVCAYTSIRALLDLETPDQTAVCILSDKEEVGSMGNTGMESQNFELFLMDLLEKSGTVHPYALQRLFSASCCLSADVTAAFDPTYPSVMEKKNSSYIGGGICFSKYTGSRGKSGASDANAEFLGFIRGIFKRNGVRCQSGELGKVDQGGGGTIAYILANKGMEVLDCGVPVLSMHSPYEVSGKYDVYMTYRGYHAFWKEPAR